MKSGRHIILSFGISIILFIYVKDALMMMSCFIFGFLIDIDHLFDFWILTGKGTRSKSELIETLNSSEFVFIPLHSWELLIVLMVFSPHHPAILGAAVGYFSHMITDLVYNRSTIEGFSVIYRMNHKWRKEILFKGFQKAA